jgi:hypothetical protein
MKQKYKLVIKQRLDQANPYIWKGWYQNAGRVMHFCYKTVVVEL